MGRHTMARHDAIARAGTKLAEHASSHCCLLSALWMARAWQLFVVCFSNCALCPEDLRPE